MDTLTTLYCGEVELNFPNPDLPPRNPQLKVALIILGLMVDYIPA